MTEDYYAKQGVQFMSIMGHYWYADRIQNVSVMIRLIAPRPFASSAVPLRLFVELVLFGAVSSLDAHYYLNNVSHFTYCQTILSSIFITSACSGSVQRMRTSYYRASAVMQHVVELFFRTVRDAFVVFYAYVQHYFLTNLATVVLLE